MDNKRNSDIAISPQVAKKKKLVCQYEEKCFRKNPHHFREYSHEHLENLILLQTDSNDLKIPPDYKPQIDLKDLKEQIKVIMDMEKASSRPSQANGSLSRIENESKKKETNKVASPKTSKGFKKDELSEKEKNTASSSKSSTIQEKYSIDKYMPVVIEKGNFLSKLEAAAPYNIFYTTISDSPETHKQSNSITFQELLDPSLGELKSSLQINFMVDPFWLLAQYTWAGYREKPLTILYGDDNAELKNLGNKLPNVKTRKIFMKSPFGTHHTKMGIYEYADGSLRVVISTANLYFDDWHNRVQGLWVSPACLPLTKECPSLDDGNGPTDFKKNLAAYLFTYNLPETKEWLEKVKKCDFSKINVFLVASVPDSHENINYDKYGHLRISSLLSKYCQIPAENYNESSNWNVVAQCSSIGSFGDSPQSWLYGQFLESFSQENKKAPKSLPKLYLVYPTLNNVKNSYDKMLGGGCLPYTRDVHQKQPWLEKYMCQWKAELTHRNRSMPHIKSYCRISPDVTKIAWFLLTSANCSKSAWGNKPKAPRLTIRSYEAGVLFFPKFLINKDVFNVVNKFTDPSVKKDETYFPFPYDLPLTQYGNDDGPFFMDYLYGR